MCNSSTLPRIHPPRRGTHRRRGRLARADRHRPQRSPIGGAGNPDYLWLQGPNQWPSRCRSCLRWSPSGMPHWPRSGELLLRHWATSLGSQRGRLDEAFAGTPATLIKIVRYPAQAESPQGVGAHRDAGVLTLLLAEPGSRGLRRVPTGASEATGNDTGASEATEMTPGERSDGSGATPGVDRGGSAARCVHRQHRRDARGRQRRLSARHRAPGQALRQGAHLGALFFNPRLDAQVPC